MTLPDVRLGLAMRFTVDIDGLNLGQWASCKGLEMTVKPNLLREMGNAFYDEVLPGQASYKPIRLERAMDASSSKAVHDWLSTTLKTWLNSPGEVYQGGTAKITLLDGAGSPVLAWSLRGVYPTGWFGPTLSAKDSTVAIESLELMHKGFLGVAAPPVESGPPQRAKLTGDGAEVMFQFNPGKVSFTQAGSFSRGKTAKHESYQESLKSISPFTIDLGDVVFAGAAAHTATTQLLAWVKPARKVAGSSETKEAADTTVALPPVLKFSWGKPGEGMAYNVLLTSVTITCQRFLESGQIAQVSANIKMEEYPENNGKTNPSSGGIPGRGQHTVVAEDTLPQIAQTTYGSPKNWRAIAEANGVDDPLRLQWGSRLFLPGPDELREKSAT